MDAIAAERLQRGLVIGAAVVAVLGGAAWWVGWLPDGVVGWPLLALVTGAGAVLGLQYAAGARTGVLKGLGVACVLMGAGVSLWLPWADALGTNVAFSGQVDGPDELVAVPQAGGGSEAYDVLVEGQLVANAGQVPFTVKLTPQGGDPLAHHDQFEDTVRAAGRKVAHHTRLAVVWPLTVDLHRGATLALSGPKDGRLQWPVRVDIRAAAPPLGLLLGLTAPLFLLAALVDASDPRRPTLALSGLVAGAVAFSIAFDSAWVPEHLTRATFAGVLVAVVCAIPAGAIAVKLARAVRPTPAERA